MHSQLQPLQTGIALFPNYIAPRGDVLILEDSLFKLTSKSAKITSEDGRPVLMASRTGMFDGIHHPITIADCQGNELFKLRHKISLIGAKFELVRGDGRSIMEIKSEMSLTGSKNHANFTNCMTGQQMQLSINGAMLSGELEIKDPSTGQTVAHFTRVGGSWGGKHYRVVVAPGMDISIVVAMGLALDERKHEKREDAEFDIL